MSQARGWICRVARPEPGLERFMVRPRLCAFHFGLMPHYVWGVRRFERQIAVLHVDI